MSQHTGTVTDLEACPIREGGPTLVASAAEDRTVRLWQPTIGRLVRFGRLESAPLCISWSLDGNWLFAGCRDGTVAVINPNSAKIVKTIHVFEGWVHTLEMHPGGSILVAGGPDGTWTRIEIGEGGNPKTLPPR
jgi:WD40 repeat protein